MAPRWRVLLCTGAMLAFSGVTQAATITASFSGHVIGGSFVLPPELVGLVAIGSPVTGTFSYDSEAPDTNPLTTRADYMQPAGLGIFVDVGGASISTDPAGTEYFVQVLDEHPLGSAGGAPVDRFALISNSNTVLAPASVAPHQLQIFFSSSNPAGIQSESLSELTNALMDDSLIFGYGQIATTATQQPKVFIGFAIDSVEPVSVPEPGTSLLLLTAGAFALVRSRLTPIRQAVKR